MKTKIRFDHILCAMVLLGLLLSGGCTAVDKAERDARGNNHSIVLYSGGEPVQEWTSSGKVYDSDTSDGFKFMDKETGRLVRVSGTLVVTILDE